MKTKEQVLQEKLDKNNVLIDSSFTRETIYEAMEEYAKGKPELLEACEEFVRKVDCGMARSKKSYKQMKEAIKIAKP